MSLILPNLKKIERVITKEETVNLKNCTAWAIYNYGTSQVQFMNQSLDPRTSDEDVVVPGFSSEYSGGLQNFSFTVDFKKVNPTDENITNKAVLYMLVINDQKPTIELECNND